MNHIIIILFIIVLVCSIIRSGIVMGILSTVGTTIILMLTYYVVFVHP
jgi:hypothetical protein